MDHFEKVATQSVADVFGTDEATSFRILVALVIGLVTTLLVFVLILSRRGKKSRTVIVAGLSNSGKTALLSQLGVKKVVDTVASMKENIWTDPIGPNGELVGLKLVDVPGSEKIRRQIFQQQIKSGLRAVVFLIDSATVVKEAKDVAEYLYDILIDPTVAGVKKLPVLVACNKQDLTVVKSAEVIQTVLAREFGLLNTTRAAALDSTEGSGEKKVLGGRSGEFQWANLPQKVDFCECSVKDGHIQPLMDWLSAL